MRVTMTDVNRLTRDDQNPNKKRPGFGKQAQEKDKAKKKHKMKKIDQIVKGRFEDVNVVPMYEDALKKEKEDDE